MPSHSFLATYLRSTSKSTSCFLKLYVPFASDTASFLIPISLTLCSSLSGHGISSLLQHLQSGFPISFPHISSILRLISSLSWKNIKPNSNCIISSGFSGVIPTKNLALLLRECVIQHRKITLFTLPKR